MCDMRTVNQRQLRNESAAVMHLVESGETVVVTRHGVPIARLQPIGPSRSVPKAVAIESARRLPPVDPTRFRADLDAVAAPFLAD